MQFKPIKTLGHGGFGVVELVENEEGQQFAKKRFQINQVHFPDELKENAKKRFIREAKVQAGLSHPNIVPLIETNLDNDPPEFIMQLASSTLANDIRADKTLNGNFLNAIMDILAGLEELHSMQIFHRDLKPQNVLKLDFPETRYAISDFGLMSINDTQVSALTHEGMQMGSDFYTAPEIVADLRKASAQSDIYSIGCILHDFVGTTQRIPCNEINDTTSPYHDILLLCTRTDPSRRFQSISDLRDSLLTITTTGQSALDLNINEYIGIMENETPPPPQVWQQMITFIEDNETLPEIHLLFHSININKIRELNNIDQTLGIRLGIQYAKWVTNGTFSFASCDGLSIRLEEFYKLDDLNCKSEVLIALLIMGTTHNRWYVERKFMSLAGESMDENIAKRFALELKILGNRGCSAINHLKLSISADLSKLHPTLQTAIEACNKS